MNEPRTRQPQRPPRPRLPAGPRWAARGLLTLPLACLTISAGVYCASLYHLLHAHLIPIAEAELARQTGHEVRIGSADFRPGALVLGDIAVANKPTFAAGNGEATLAARRVTVAYNLRALVFDSGNAAHALGDITLEQPSLLIERYPGRYNFSDFFKPKTKKVTKPFVGRILVHNGLLRFRDFEAPDRGKRPALNTLASVEGTVDFFSERNIYFDVRGSGTNGRVASLIVNGDVSRQFAGRYQGHVVATDADAAYWTDYFKAFPQARILVGRADADVTLAKLGAKPPPGLPLDLSGHIAIRSATIAVTDKKLLRLPLENLTGTAAFTGAGVSLDARVSLGGQPLAVSGAVFDFAHPQVALTAKSTALDPIRLAQALPALILPKGFQITPGQVTADFTGAVASPTITVSAFLPAVAYSGIRATNLTASATYANKILTVPTASFGLNGSGRGILRATLDTSGKTPVYLLAGTVSGVNLAGLRLPSSASTKNLSFGGQADAQFLLDNQNRPVTLTANFAVAKPRLRQTAFDSLQGRVAWTLGQALTITHAALRGSNGAAAVSGTIPAGVKNGQWNLSVRTAGLDISPLLKPYSNAALSGRAAFDGKVVGPANAPEAVGAVRLIEPQFGRFSADLVSGNVAANFNGVHLQNVTVRRFPTLAGLDGSVTGLTSGDPKLALNVRLSQGDVSDFLQLAEQASAPSPKTAHALESSLNTLTGTAEGAFHLGGSVKSPRVYGHALIADATVGSYRVDQVAADLRYDGGVLRIENGRLQSGTAILTAHGYRTASGRIDADFTTTGLDLARFYPVTDPYAEITGTAGFSGRFFGTPTAPHVVVRALTLADLIVNSQKFAPLTLAGRYDDGIFTQTGDPWRLIVTVPTDYAAEPGGVVEYDVNALRLILPTATHPKRIASLALSAGIPESAPERLSHVFTTIRTSQFGRSDTGRKFLAQLARLPQPLSGTFALPRLIVQGPLSALAAQAELRGGNLTLGDAKVAGLAASLAYTAGKNPDGTVTASAHDILISGVPIGAASADADYHNRIVTLHSLKATSERAYLSASGTANLDGPISATLDASNIPLSLLHSAVPKAAPYLNFLPGEISTLSVAASGLTRSPNLIGSISLSNPEQPLPSASNSLAPTYALDRIRSGTISLESATPDAPKVLTVTDLAAFKNGKLIATLSGTLPILPDLAGQSAALLPDQDLHADLIVSDLSALAGFSPGLLDTKKTGGQLTASASYGGGVLSGLVTITDASVGLNNFDTFANKINGIVVLADNKATIQSFTGQSSKGGSLALSGGAVLGGSNSVNLKIAATDLTVDENSKQNFLYQKFSSGLKAKVNGALTVIGPWLTPKIATPSGAPIVISDASGTLPSASNAAVTPGGPPVFDPFFDLAVQLGGNGRSKTITVSNALLKAEAGGLVTLKGRLSDPQLRADVVVARGQLTLPPSTVLKIFKPVTGDVNTVNATYPVAGPDGLPSLSTRVDIWAQTTVTPSAASLAQGRSVAGGSIGESAPSVTALSNDNLFSGGQQRYVITVHVHGILNSPDLFKLDDLTSQPPGLSQTQMLAALVPASTLITGGGSNLEAGVKQALISAALSPLTSTIGDALGLSDLNVVYDPNLPLFVTVTKQIGPRLDVTYSRSFGTRGVTGQTTQPPQYTVQLGYDLTRRLRLGVATDDRKSKIVTLETVLRF